ncbi:MAG: hypothetical protein LQ337_004184 [Flavoplaca oasis]|nr:MAG: hypothetical protein LQ337_004184 [Flavoplaca oasis]
MGINHESRQKEVVHLYHKLDLDKLDTNTFVCQSALLGAGLWPAKRFDKAWIQLYKERNALQGLSTLLEEQTAVLNEGEEPQTTDGPRLELVNGLSNIQEKVDAWCQEMGWLGAAFELQETVKETMGSFLLLALVVLPNSEGAESVVEVDEDMGLLDREVFTTNVTLSKTPTTRSALKSEC